MKNLSLKSRFMYYSGILIASLGAEVTEDLCRISGLIEADEKEKSDGCMGCAFYDVNEWELPCTKCKRNSIDYWRAKHEDEG